MDSKSRRENVLRFAVLTLLVAASLVMAADGPSAAPTTAPAADPSLDTLVVQLGDPSYRKREAAAEALTDAGPSAYTPMRRAFRADPNYETRRRIYEVARRVFFTQKLGPPPAFLGIQLMQGAPQVELRPLYPSAAEDDFCVPIDAVINGTAADAAGLKQDDLIVALNGKPLKARSADNPALTEWISRQRPGTRCELDVIRKNKRLTVTVRLGTRPYDIARSNDPADIERIRATFVEFREFWRSEFDPKRTIDTDTPSAENPNWRPGAFNAAE